VAGTLHVVATPLGNLDDLSLRARDTLAGSALIACEDTRRTAKLLAHCGLNVPMVAVHRFSERDRLDAVLIVLARGDDVALVSDGGTPGVSDPGALLVAAALDAGMRVSPVPGPSAVVAVLSAAGLPGDRFVFDGFLPPRAGERRNRLRALSRESRTVVVYEAPHRVKASLADMAEVLGARTIVLGRELTKVHETILRGSAHEVLLRLGDGDIKGEIAIAVAGYDASSSAVDAGDDQLKIVWTEALAANGGDTRDALNSASKSLGIKKPELRRRLAERGLVHDGPSNSRNLPPSFSGPSSRGRTRT
jgi:16S rRNA (cytidine1402-2'-O)-methyltransferase